MTLNGLIGRRGHLQTLQEFWIVGRFILTSILARDFPRSVLACQQMFKLDPPSWYLQSLMKDMLLLKHMKFAEEDLCQLTREVPNI